MDLFDEILFSFGPPALGLVMVLVLGWGVRRYLKGQRPAYLVSFIVTICVLLAAVGLAYYGLLQVNFSY